MTINEKARSITLAIHYSGFSGVGSFGSFSYFYIEGQLFTSKPLQCIALALGSIAQNKIMFAKLVQHTFNDLIEKFNLDFRTIDKYQMTLENNLLGILVCQESNYVLLRFYIPPFDENNNLFYPNYIALYLNEKIVWHNKNPSTFNERIENDLVQWKILLEEKFHKLLTGDFNWKQYRIFETKIKDLYRRVISLDDNNNLKVKLWNQDKTWINDALNHFNKENDWLFTNNE